MSFRQGTMVIVNFAEDMDVARVAPGLRFLLQEERRPRLRLRVSVEGRQENSMHDRIPVLCVETTILPRQLAGFPAEAVAPFDDTTATAWLPSVSLRAFPEDDGALNIVEVVCCAGGAQLAAAVLQGLQAISAVRAHGRTRRRTRRCKGGVTSLTALLQCVAAPADAPADA